MNNNRHGPTLSRVINTTWVYPSRLKDCDPMPLLADDLIVVLDSAETIYFEDSPSEAVRGLHPRLGLIWMTGTAANMLQEVVL